MFPITWWKHGARRDIQGTGGRGGIRTLGGFNTTAAFQATALNRYATRPYSARVSLA